MNHIPKYKTHIYKSRRKYRKNLCELKWDRIRYKTKSIIYKRKKNKLYFIKIKYFSSVKKNGKIKHRLGENVCKSYYLIRNVYPEYI